MIDKNEAPDGYEAAAFSSNFKCMECAFKDNVDCSNWNCEDFYRDDGEEVIFIRKSTAPATLLHPMGKPRRRGLACFRRSA